MVMQYSQHMQTTHELIDCLNEFGLDGVREYGLMKHPLAYRVRHDQSDEEMIVLDTMRDMPVTRDKYFSMIKDSIDSVVDFGVFDGEDPHGNWQNILSYGNGWAR